MQFIFFIIAVGLVYFTESYWAGFGFYMVATFIHAMVRGEETQNYSTNPKYTDPKQHTNTNRQNYRQSSSSDYTYTYTYKDEIALAYDTLGVKSSATNDQIKKAYREQVLRWHPDRNNSDKASAKFLEIQAAYDIIKTQRGII